MLTEEAKIPLIYFLPLFLLALNPPESFCWHYQGSFPCFLGWQSFVLTSSYFLVQNVVPLMQQLVSDAGFHDVGFKTEGSP